MEDQQSATGDLTAQDRASTGPDEGAESAAAATDSTAAESTAAGGDAVDDNAVDDDAAPTEPAPDGRRRKRLAGKRLAIAVVAAAVLFVGSAGFAGASLQPYLSDRATAATKLNVARTAARAITTLWTYTPENMDTLADRASAYLSGDFEAQYRKFVDAIVAPNKQAKITNSTEVTGAAVESLDENNAVVIVYTNTSSTSPLTKNIPSLKYLSYRLFMKRSQSRWLVTRMTTITSLDLTPHV
ncbi:MULTISPECIES: mammalian cell entry protein [unclassified Mycobacterium]|uniref:mammalian cell entry protein n=1 Tax=unclassified Mycobacterium TaxID=2642494 RepID=UPI0007FDB55E|nr:MULTISPECIES: mammalian cell entry protein [unclassified Mycobacterium]OBG78626.1 mammalian cell entry protein [Mycobacterium sp. E1214]OBH27481.1 mammalian cell entry protein [Mycobacterium sp. E1319]